MTLLWKLYQTKRIKPILERDPKEVSWIWSSKLIESESPIQSSNEEF